MKTCTQCGAAKPEAEFSTDAKGAEGLSRRCRPCAATWQREYFEAHPKRKMLIGARCRAKRVGIPFSLLEEDFEIPDRCPVFGQPLIFGKGSAGDWSPSLDKIVPELGYVPGNVEVISYKANRAKGNLTPEELRLLADYYAE